MLIILILIIILQSHVDQIITYTYSLIFEGSYLYQEN